MNFFPIVGLDLLTTFSIFGYIRLIDFNKPNLGLSTLINDISFRELCLKSFLTINAEHLVVKYCLR